MAIAASGIGRSFTQIFLGSGKHQLDTVQLVDFAGARIIVYGNNIGLRITAAQLLDNAFSDNMVGQTAKWLGADNVFHSVVD